MPRNILQFLTLLFCCLSAVPVFAFQHSISSEDSTYIYDLLKESQSLIEQGELASARQMAKQADSLSQQIGFENGQVLASVRFADILITERQLDSALVILNDLIENYPENKHIIQAYNIRGSAYSYKNEQNEALRSFSKALELVPLMDEDQKNRTRAGIRQNMATAYVELGMMNEAFENYIDAVRFAEMTRDTVIWATILNNIGNAYNGVENYDRAAFYLEKAMDLAEEKNLKPELYRTSLNLANSRNGQNQLQEALELYNRALELDKELRPDFPPVTVLYNLGRLNAKLENYEQAEAFYRESLGYSTELGIPQGIYYNNFGLGNLFFEKGEVENAIRYLEEANEAALGMGNTPIIQEVRGKLYEAYRQANRYEGALEYLELYKQISDSLTNIEKQQALAELENQLELDRQSEVNRLLQDKQQQQENQLLFQYILIIVAALVIVLIVIILFMMKKSAREREEINAKLEQQKVALEEANRAKDKLFAIIAHDLRSPLTSMQGVLHLINENVLSNQDIKDLLPELELSVQKNVNVMEDLLAWAKEQLWGVKMDITSVNINEVVKEILSSQALIAKKKGLIIDQSIPKEEEVLADRNALQLVIRNLISNSIKFSGEGDKISVTVKSNSQNTQLIIKDTGIGIPKVAVDKIFESKSWTREGTNKEKGSGFGLSLSKEFVERMNGKIWFESTEGEGSTFYVELPNA